MISRYAWALVALWIGQFRRRQTLRQLLGFYLLCQLGVVVVAVVVSSLLLWLISWVSEWEGAWRSVYSVEGEYFSLAKWQLPSAGRDLSALSATCKGRLACCCFTQWKEEEAVEEGEGEAEEEADNCQRIQDAVQQSGRKIRERVFPVATFDLC